MIKKLWFISLFLLISSIGIFADSVGYEKFFFKNIPVDSVKIDIRDKNIEIKPVIVGKGYKSFSAMMKEEKPITAINGTYFDTKTFRPVGTILIDGKLRCIGDKGTAFCLNNDGSISFKLVSGILGSKIDWTGVNHALCSGPTLISLSVTKDIYSFKKEGFRYQGLYLPAWRSAIGLTIHNKIVFVNVKSNIYFEDLIEIMQFLKCKDAIALDGGSATALYYRGKYITYPGRAMTNIVVVKGK